jgi:hypothetical protein
VLPLWASTSLSLYSQPPQPPPPPPPLEELLWLKQLPKLDIYVPSQSASIVLRTSSKRRHPATASTSGSKPHVPATSVRQPVPADHGGHFSPQNSLDLIVARFPCGRDAERMDVHLATECFFGESVMGLSTPTGVGGGIYSSIQKC